MESNSVQEVIGSLTGASLAADKTWLFQRKSSEFALVGVLHVAQLPKLVGSPLVE